MKYKRGNKAKWDFKKKKLGWMLIWSCMGKPPSTGTEHNGEKKKDNWITDSTTQPHKTRFSQTSKFVELKDPN